MSSHTVQVNNFIKVKEKPKIDLLSKIFFIIQWVLGVNRMRLLTNRTILNVLSTIYVLVLFSGLTYMAVYLEHVTFFVDPKVVKFIQCIFCWNLCYTSRNKIQQYYEQLNKFDTQAKCKPKVNRVSIVIFLSMVAICILTMSAPIFSCPGMLVFIPLHLIQIVENHYYAYLFNLLNQRLQIINNRIETSLLSNPDFATTVKVSSVDPNEVHQRTELEINKLMDFYYVIINAYDFLTDGIKWQLLFIIITSFLFTLFISYNSAVDMLSGEYNTIRMFARIVMVGSETVPLIAPCMCCDKVRYEVRRLRELLASKLFESKLDKSNRSIARALLALTKARNLSFSLLRMVDISISLPFSFLGLIATYLIILLQFQKVLNP